MTTPRQPLEIQVGGQLNPRKHLFVARQDIEDELYDKLARCEYCTVHEDRRFVDNGKIITSAGIAAGIDMSLHVVERLLSQDVAVITARHMEYPWGNN